MKIFRSALCAVVLATLPLTACSDDESTDEAVERSSAYTACKEFVTKRLRAPGTASYPDFFRREGTEVFVTETANGYSIRSHVDSENAFGGEVRTDWTCEVSDQGDSWRLEDISVG